MRLRGRFAFENADLLLGGTAKASRIGCAGFRWARTKVKTCGVLGLLLLSGLTAIQLYRSFGTSSLVGVLHRSWEHSLQHHAHAHNTTGCMNSAQGHTFITDSEGTICLRHHVQDNGCCGRPVAELSCDGCLLGCCEIFEYCLSCCLRTVQQHENRELNKGDFSKCLYSCRTSSRSLRRGNLYKFANFPYCFDSNVPSMLSSYLLAGRMPLFDEPQPSTGAVLTLTAIVSNISQSCREACASLGWECHEAYFPFVNNCSALRHHFPCERCDVDHPLGSDQPSFIVSRAPDDLKGLMQYEPTPEPWWSWLMEAPRKPSELGALNPDTCLVNSDAESFDCDGFHPFSQRLCPCATVISLGQAELGET